MLTLDWAHDDREESDFSDSDDESSKKMVLASKFTGLLGSGASSASVSFQGLGEASLLPACHASRAFMRPPLTSSALCSPFQLPERSCPPLDRTRLTHLGARRIRCVAVGRP